MKFIDMFSGIGGFRSALELSGHECIAYSEIDKYAKQSYQAMYDTENEIGLGDITEISQEYLSRFKEENDIVVGGSPCFRKGTLITTKEGLKPIEDIKKGDYVLTHNNRYKKVVVPMVNPSNEIYKLKAMNSVETFVTPEHPFYVIERSTIWNNKKRSYDYEYSKEKWVKSKDLVKGRHFIKLGQADEVNNPKNITKEEAWLIGRYIADGYLIDSKRPNRKNSYRRDVVFCVGKDKKDVFESNLQYYNMNPSENRTVYKYRKQNERLFNLMSVCGKGAKNKGIPFEYLQLPKDKLEILLEGYFSGDGSYKDNVYSYTTISKKLALSLVQAMNKVYGNGASIVFTERPKTTVIEERTVNQNNTYKVQLRKEYLADRKPQTLNIDNKLYTPIKKLEKQETNETVYNFEVEDDNSYVANNMVVHNCQSFSLAGSRKGFEDTRGTLFFEYAKVVKETQPKYFLFENVKGMMSHDKGNTIRVVLETFNELGYYIDFNVFNSKYYGVPQNRERIYIVGKRKDLVEQPKYHVKTKGKKKFDEVHNWAVDNINYVELLPPLQTEVTTRLVDVLEDEVDEKFYLSDEKVEKLMLGLNRNQDQNCVAVREATKQGYAIAEQGDSVNYTYPTSKTRRGRVGKQVAQTLQAGEVNQGVVINPLKGKTKHGWHFEQAVYDSQGITRTVKANGGSGNIPKTIEVNQGVVTEDKGIRFTEDGFHTHRKDKKKSSIQGTHVTYKKGRTHALTSNHVPMTLPQGVIIDDTFSEQFGGVKIHKDTAPTLRAGRSGLKTNDGLRIRKLTPLECWRLQGFTDEQFYKAKNDGVSNSQLYKQAGNSVTVNVIDAIVKELK